jgi:hypothetical protein
MYLPVAHELISSAIKEGDIVYRNLFLIANFLL